MSGVERSDERIKSTGEIFTPDDAVASIVNSIPAEIIRDPTKTFLDPSCGDGQFLVAVLRAKTQNGSTKEQALRTIFGVDIMSDNVELCRERLLGDNPEFRHIVEKNIVCADFLAHEFGCL